MTKRRDDIEQALNETLRAEFPPDELGKPRSAMAKRCEHIVTTACLIADCGIEVYNFEEQPARRWVRYNLRYKKSDDDRNWVAAGAICIQELQIKSDEQLIMEIAEGLSGYLDDSPGKVYQTGEECP